jgi:hypothetical protein
MTLHVAGSALSLSFAHSLSLATPPRLSNAREKEREREKERIIERGPESHEPA